jgi:transcriptional/translational regulatory protein YebC/TACO1
MENSFMLLGQFSKQARRAGMAKEKIDAYIKDATSGDREHLEEVLYEALSEIEGD